MQKLEKKMEDPLVLELRQEFTKAIQKLSLEINEIERMLRGNLKIQSSESIKDIPAFARKSSKEVMDFEESMESPASMMILVIPGLRRNKVQNLKAIQVPRMREVLKRANFLRRWIGWNLSYRRWLI